MSGTCQSVEMVSFSAIVLFSTLYVKMKGLLAWRAACSVYTRRQ